MVFAPTRGGRSGPPEPRTTTPSRGGGSRPLFEGGGGSSLAWRAFVRMRDQEAVQTAWHLAGCTAPHQADAHCPEGQRLIESVGEPDGHCLLDGRCARCEEQAKAAA